MLLFYVPFALFIFYAFNTMAQKFCTKSEMSNEKSTKVYRMINISMLVLLISSYYEVNFL
ncbi:hypothetical protein [Alkalibacillus salilacus]|uniref:TRAP-type mannitol/chloroaromatic compound transport system permease small subunit n=1 Tax=Alkalibacillus salilacus TaxID=284582 RepID=A0ABT9VG21_9BACI|nr:hypothetical protein [Alkalibacillus salilacus]MDQ0159923.1 TRAP-type mannitol/chloroaromatic compound transport system permease small subunit [Alkalibacillus salilacus]